MNLIPIGKIVKTHGIKGEVCIISRFSQKNLVFQPGFKLYINNTCLVINTYRIHKNYDMVTFNGFDNINDVLPYRGLSVYIDKDDLKVPHLIEDLVGYEIIWRTQSHGRVQELREIKNSILLYVKNQSHYYYIPYNPEFIKNVDYEQQIIEVERIEELE